MFQNNGNEIDDFIEECVKELLQKNKVTVITAINGTMYKSFLVWDPRELIYRYRGEISKRYECDPFHRYICMEVIVEHMRHSIGIALIDNGPNSLCPIIEQVDRIHNSDEFEL